MHSSLYMLFMFTSTWLTLVYITWINSTLSFYGLFHTQREELKMKRKIYSIQRRHELVLTSYLLIKNRSNTWIYWFSKRLLVLIETVPFKYVNVRALVGAFKWFKMKTWPVWIFFSFWRVIF